MIIILERKIDEFGFPRVDDLEAFLDHLIFNRLSVLKSYNNVKKKALIKCDHNLRQISMETVHECIARLTDDERKHFILKNQDFFEAKKLDRSAETARHKQDDYFYEIKLEGIQTRTLIQMATDLTAYIDKYSD
jgi:hypothetical protein